MTLYVSENPSEALERDHPGLLGRVLERARAATQGELGSTVLDFEGGDIWITLLPGSTTEVESQSIKYKFNDRTVLIVHTLNYTRPITVVYNPGILPSAPQPHSPDVQMETAGVLWQDSRDPSRRMLTPMGISLLHRILEKVKESSMPAYAEDVLTAEGQRIRDKLSVAVNALPPCRYTLTDAEKTTLSLIESRIFTESVEVRAPLLVDEPDNFDDTEDAGPMPSFAEDRIPEEKPRFDVGQKVISDHFGIGRVVSRDDCGRMYPVKVTFDTEESGCQSFTENGRYSTEVLTAASEWDIRPLSRYIGKTSDEYTKAECRAQFAKFCTDAAAGTIDLCTPGGYIGPVATPTGDTLHIRNGSLSVTAHVDFEVGQSVMCDRRGVGKVVSATSDSTIYPVRVQFDSDIGVRQIGYTREGRYFRNGATPDLDLHHCSPRALPNSRMLANDETPTPMAVKATPAKTESTVVCALCGAACPPTKRQKTFSHCVGGCK